MPDPISDSLDPEWGTSSNAAEITESLDRVYSKITNILCGQSPMFIIDLVKTDLPEPINATLTTKEWRIIRFALERARDSL